ncbi:MAG: DUF547 domain-containing protein [Symploca sp. SIO3C6]|uniref:DUF547 domain-containing protein n=1 Tax=Symploca sp. SIO1C4 TaxID=2607765 RepID=A0A6B3N8X2_9CYAN|nr:DUF547 domain-containing protein [Symploca sp. SIO3C6]NER28050.1 DUF547 domain-containing protein [Symploca sp. SIO1C4]NET06765.1 DUF547 domain-containing protein [Symploca sp. SIO2B6]
MNKFNRFLVLFPALIVITGCAGSFSSTQAQQEISQIETSSTASAETLSYDDYAAVLETYIDEKALVDYQGLKVNRQQLDKFNASLGQVTASTYESWSSAEQIAFWINAYNSFTLESIIDQNPLKKSIKDIPGVWKGRKFQIAAQSKTLDNIEHQTLRKDFNEPRIHVALVCAAMSCPPLRDEPYTGEKLDAQLDDQTRIFLNSPQGFRIDRQEGRVYLSSIFKWFGKDWEKTYGVDGKFTGNASQRAVLNFISGYLSAEDKEYLAQGNYKVRYLDYDWSLNSQNKI